MFVDDLRNDRQPKSDAFRFRRKEWVEDTLAVFHRDSRAAVDHRDFSHSVGGAGLHGDYATGRRRFGGIG